MTEQKWKVQPRTRLGWIFNLGGLLHEILIHKSTSHNSNFVNGFKTINHKIRWNKIQYTFPSSLANLWMHSGTGWNISVGLSSSFVRSQFVEYGGGLKHVRYVGIIRGKWWIHVHVDWMIIKIICAGKKDIEILEN